MIHAPNDIKLPMTEQFYALNTNNWTFFFSFSLDYSYGQALIESYPFHLH